jgi:hypothetical protein
MTESSKASGKISSMAEDFQHFERIVRNAHVFTESDFSAGSSIHPFEERNLHSDLPAQVRKLFDNGHYAQATFEALKYLDEEVQRISVDQDYGKSLMMRVFGGNPPKASFKPRDDYFRTERAGRIQVYFCWGNGWYQKSSWT